MCQASISSNYLSYLKINNISDKARQAREGSASKQSSPSHLHLSPNFNFNLAANNRFFSDQLRDFLREMKVKSLFVLSVGHETTNVCHVIT